MKITTSPLVGIDVSSKKLDLYFFSEKKNKELSKKMDNNTKGFGEIEKSITKSTTIVLEATGVYHYNLCSYFFLKGYTIKVVNPTAIKYYGMSKLKRDKTDKIDARLIYDYGKNMILSQDVKVHNWRKPSVSSLKRQQLLSMIQLETKHLNAYSSQYHSFKNCNDTSQEIFDWLQDKIQAVEEVIADYEKELNKLNTEEDKSFLKLVKTISGIGDKSAMVFLHTFQQFTNFESAKQVICYLGTNPREYESGSSVKKYKGISKMGVKDARKILYMAALSAKKYNTACRSLYKRLRERGKKHKQAMVAVINKLVKQAFAIVKSGEPYNPEYYSLSNRAA
ncbi:IS110 family RNA-guided transposase [Flammeovirga aprica]|uniref:IS110 family transposase n=1 Tax=Flammeovirga aprica JL-4 TaxID=694437 RepID=A0A7X9S264_9BACT|nr:IS110 family transposase [Flammeovirga aprica]NME72992.1 IS110 family transposase [Flammeovirga aprica JL-4]